MEYCWNQKKYTKTAVPGVVVSVFVAVFAIVGFAADPRWDTFAAICKLFGIGVFLFFAYMTVMNLMICLRKYAITGEGFVIQCPGCSPVVYSWDKISEVGICKVHYPNRGPFRYDLVIRIVIGEEEYGPRQGYGNWTTWFYEVRHYRNIITILYNTGCIVSLEKFCPLAITDYRGIKRYSDDPE